MQPSSEAPVLIRWCLPDRLRTVGFYRGLVLILTYLSYTSFHLSRRPFSIVKNVLNKNCSEANLHNNDTTWCDWAPFNGSDASTLFGLLDSCFLITYALGMFASGIVAERCNLRYFLTLGMLLSGLFTCALGGAFYYDIHSLAFFVIFQILSGEWLFATLGDRFQLLFFLGLFQTTGWPSVVACVGNWFNKSSRGVIFGLWNSHTNFGNILGAAIAGAFVDYNWGLSFIVPGLIIAGFGLVMFLLLVPCECCISIETISFKFSFH